MSGICWARFVWRGCDGKQRLKEGSLTLVAHRSAGGCLDTVCESMDTVGFKVSQTVACFSFPVASGHSTITEAHTAPVGDLRSKLVRRRVERRSSSLFRILSNWNDLNPDFNHKQHARVIEVRRQLSRHPHHRARTPNVRNSK